MEDIPVTKKETQLSHEPHGATAHRYQVYRQSKNGCHYNYGDRIASPDQAVGFFLNASPAFEGGGLHLWDHREQRAVASAEWFGEITRMGFAVRTRANVFHDEALAVIARGITEREALEETISSQLRMTV